MAASAKGIDRHSGGNGQAGRAEAIRVLIVSRVRLHRECLEDLLATSTAMSVGGRARTAIEVVPDAAECEVVLFDAVSGADMRGIHEMVRQHPETRILALGVPDVGAEVLALAKAGVAGYLSAEATTKQLIDAIRRVARGETPCSPGTFRTLLGALGTPSSNGLAMDHAFHDPQESLTDRELEVLAHVAGGLSNKEIARLLHIEVATVKNHVHSILQKLNLQRRAQAAHWLRQQKFGSDQLNSPESIKI